MFITLLSMGIVLYLILGIANYSNINRVSKTADSLMEILKENEGRFPSKIETDELGEPITEETPFETRYFTVTLNEKGEVISVDTSKIASFDNEEAKQLAFKLYQENSNDGFAGTIKYSTLNINNNTMYIFIDFSRSIIVAKSFMIYSYAISFVGMLLFALLLGFLSKVVIKPVEESYIKQNSFITNVSHDIKTPLTIISADTELIEMEYGENEWTSDVKSQVNRLTSLTNKLVFLTKINEDQFVLNKQEMNLSQALLEIIENFQAVSTNQSKEIIHNIDKDINYNGNEEMIRQMIYLLIDNAIKYSESTINISLIKASRYIEFIIENDVENIEVGNHNKLFERFYRLESSRNSQTGGNGIGLSVVKAIVDMHSGKITCDSENPKSIKFRIIL